MGLLSTISVLSALLVLTSGIRVEVAARDNQSKVYNVGDYGAVGDGKSDNNKAFLQAWNDLCTDTSNPSLVIPEGTFLLTPIVFNGPCKSAGVSVQIEGTILAPDTIDAWAGNPIWITFSNIENLNVQGPGKLDGRGSIWWDNYGEGSRPVALSFRRCNGLNLRGLNHFDSPRAHITINGCNNVIFSNLNIVAPESSPNTDGVDISSSSQIQILDTVMATGDDCIAVNDGVSGLNVTNVKCGPGHGISVGSIGKDGAYTKVEDVYVKNCTFKGTMNGARIKTWPGGSGYAKGIRYEDISLEGVYNPIIIDQHYGHGEHDGPNKTSAVAISDVIFRNIKGTSLTDYAINFNCSETVPCTGVTVDHVAISPATPGKETAAFCNNAQGTSDAVAPPVTCLSS